MGYYMRFFQTDDAPLTLTEIEAGLQAIDTGYAIEGNAPEDDVGELTYAGDLYGQIEVNRVGTDLADEELGEFRERIEDDSEGDRERVLAVVAATRAILAVRVLWQGREAEPTLRRLDPLWEWLFETHEGLMHADGEGFYDEENLVLEVS